MKKIIRRIFNRFNLDIRKFNPQSDSMSQIFKAISAVNTNLIFDIGANAGQFTSELKTRGYRGKVVSFEPLTSARDKLIKEASKHSNWIVHKRAAIGNYCGNIEINVSNNSVSSSILPMLNSHTKAAPDSVYVHKEKTPLITLDSIYGEYICETSNLFLKLDTQGYESFVLDGASKTLNKANGIICELSLIPLYEDQVLWRDIIERLEKDGFILWSLLKGFTDPQNGRSLQVDAVFLKKLK
tara:strand:+ start:1840 stop:2562 length:723 start_codon:yes stop_codon:yes gene_type:complete